MTPERLKEIAAQLLSIAEELDPHIPTTAEKFLFCAGCYGDVYNGKLAKECWNLTTAKIVQRKFVHIDDVPPWTTQKAVTTLSCHHRQKYISVKPEQTC
jgi:hypothetical protein